MSECSVSFSVCPPLQELAEIRVSFSLFHTSVEVVCNFHSPYKFLGFTLHATQAIPRKNPIIKQIPQIKTNIHSAGLNIIPDSPLIAQTRESRIHRADKPKTVISCLHRQYYAQQSLFLACISDTKQLPYIGFLD